MPQHDPETVRIGRENIARIREQLGVAPTRDSPDEQEPRVSETGEQPTDELTVDRIQVEMATAEERDQMKATIERLEGRVAQLEATLAAVVRTAASGIESKGDVDDVTR